MFCSSSIDSLHCIAFFDFFVHISVVFKPLRHSLFCVNKTMTDSIYDFPKQRDIVRDISFRRRRFELKLLSSNNSVIKLLHAHNSVGLS